MPGVYITQDLNIYPPEIMTYAISCIFFLDVCHMAQIKADLCQIFAGLFG